MAMTIPDIVQRREFRVMNQALLTCSHVRGDFAKLCFVAALAQFPRKADRVRATVLPR